VKSVTLTPNTMTGSGANAMKISTDACHRRLSSQMVSVKKIPPLVLAVKITSTLTLSHIPASQLQAVIHGNTWMIMCVMNWPPTQV
jgi:hypothetical protein